MVGPGQERHLVVELSDGVGFAGALYLRDRFGLPAWTHIPALAPTITTRAIQTRVPDEDWDGWWRLLVESAPASPVAPPPGSALADLYRGVREEQVRWVQGQHPESSEAIRGYRPHWLPPWIGASSARGRCVTEVVPVGGSWSLALTPRRLLVSVELMRDHTAMDALWREQLAALEGP
ncbi:hypothetical protein HP550_01810 [Cellulomonas humilata]|uniref:Uncharacterized protein n=1 Tax=Cellulomonas humilata TaxID=144055 RepID=A0A7Y6DW94_9CELL|nr:hypothetical protein [Cellulomonas humilata]NUU15985.1 hypothetical protein [Cellulomonas humilata]